MLPSSADGPSECLELMNLTFRCMRARRGRADAVVRRSGCIDCDYGPAYRYHRRVLKLLQWHRPPTGGG